MIANIFLFVPVGFLLRKARVFGHRSHGLAWALLFGALISILIETSQLFLDRSTNIADIIMNSLGTGIGYWITRFFTVHLYTPGKIRTIRLGFIWIYVVSIAGLFIYPAFENRARWWKEKYPVVIGNEGDSSRPWLGELYKAAVYDKTFTPGEARKLYQNRYDPDTEFRNAMRTIVCYPLTEGLGDTLHDMSGLEPPISLIGNKIEWLPSGGIRCSGGLIRSKMGSDKIVHKIDSTQQFSVEVWLKPGNLTQGGPARIFSVSPDVNRRNFTLAQEGHEFRLRVRSHLGGWNGSEINLVVPAVFDSIASYHLIATFNRGTEQLFINGKRHPKALFTHFDYLPKISGFGSRDLAKWLFFFILFLPLAILVNTQVYHRVLWTVIFCGTVVLMIDLLLAAWLKQPLCLSLHIINLFASAVGCLMTAWFKQS